MALDQETKDFIKTEMSELAGMIGRGFAQVDQRFAQVDQRFAQVDQRFAQVDQRFAQVDQRLEGVEEAVADLRTTVDRIDLRTQHQVDAVYEDTAKLKKDMKVAQTDILTLKAHAGLKV